MGCLDGLRSTSTLVQQFQVQAPRVETYDEIDRTVVETRVAAPGTECHADEHHGEKQDPWKRRVVDGASG
jgi:hypothetical protein